MNTQTEEATQEQIKTDSLADRSKRIKHALSNGSIGPLVAAKEVNWLASNWEKLQEEASGVTCSQWLRGVCGIGRGLEWWSKRFEAVTRLGESCRRKVDHSVAVYVAENVGDEHLDEVKTMLFLAYKQNGSVPITLAMARTRVYEIIGKKPSRKNCAKCRKYEALLKAHGIDPDEEIH